MLGLILGRWWALLAALASGYQSGFLSKWRSPAGTSEPGTRRCPAWGSQPASCSDVISPNSPRRRRGGSGSWEARQSRSALKARGRSSPVLGGRSAGHHPDARPHVPGDLERREARSEGERRERVPKRVRLAMF
jgi:hypothetical protein